MKNTSEDFYVIMPPGFEQICAKELKQFLDTPLTITRGGISFTGKLRELYLVNLWSRCASRILVRIGSVKCRDFPTLFNRASRLPWGRFIKPHHKVALRVSCHSSRLNHSDRVATTIEEAIHKALGSIPVSEEISPEQQTVFVRIENDICTLSVDSSGDLLHKRGYRQQATNAPLRETLAAGCLLHCNWTGQEPLWDPFCGSGTFPIEAALIAANIPPGISRKFAFMSWPGFRRGLWEALLSEADRGIKKETGITIDGSDIDEQAVESARQNAQQAGVAQFITFRHADAFQAQAPTDDGLIICNPPYGERLALTSTPTKLLKKLGRQLHDNYPSWHGYALLPYHGTPSATTSVLSSNEKDKTLFNFSNGGIDVALYPLDKS
ncbi:MAG: hypothetical protein B6I36_00675 [Desulfobacteraceae bacterium 4572_35.1]|nr:MAG: hypothetical protein B6I36_00675 [Desulfobacteraceae bacterium 4572_35.1]